MKRHILTRDTTLPADAAIYVAQVKSTSPGAAGLYTPLFGPLNQLIAFVELGEGKKPATATLPHSDKIRTREVQMLEEVYRFVADDGCPIYDFRIYDIAFGMGATYAGLMAGIMPARERYSRNYGIWRSETGRPDQIVHLWGYESVAQRDDVRIKVSADPDWQHYASTIRPMLVAMQSAIVAPVR